MIQDLEPLPGRGFTTEEPRYITPGHLRVREAQRRVAHHAERGRDARPPDQPVLPEDPAAERTRQDKEYLLDKLRGAEFLIKSINKRRKTIRRVMESILKFQREFFEHGVRAAPAAGAPGRGRRRGGAHEHGESRVTTNKYVHTSHGTFELKYFFSAARPKQQTRRADMSSEAIKSKIKHARRRRGSRRSRCPTRQIANAAEAGGRRSRSLGARSPSIARRWESFPRPAASRCSDFTIGECS